MVDNQLLTLPTSIGNLKSLRILDLRNNQLTSLPNSIGNLQSLEELDLRHNEFITIPTIIRKLKNVRQYFLKLEGNPFNIQSARMISKDVKSIREFLKMKDKLKDIVKKSK